MRPFVSHPGASRNFRGSDGGGGLATYPERAGFLRVSVRCGLRCRPVVGKLRIGIGAMSGIRYKD